IISFSVRPEWSISHPFNEKLSVIFKKEFRDRPNSRVCAHSGNSLVQPPHRRKDFNGGWIEQFSARWQITAAKPHWLTFLADTADPAGLSLTQRGKILTVEAAVPTSP